MSATEEKTAYVGSPVKRREDRALLTGHGTYVDNMAPVGTLSMAVVRSPYAHARVTSVSLDAAREAEGVVAVFSAADLQDDWKAALLWRALYDAGVFVNVAIHPAVPPGGALLRTSVMATHDVPTLDRALDAFASVKAAFEAEHGPLPSP